MKSLTFTLLLVCFTLSGALAQTYYFSNSSDAYVDLVGSTSLTNTTIWDDPQAIIPIGFDFTFFDSTISTIYLDNWGLGGELTLDTTETGIYGLLIPYGADIMDRGYKFNAGEAPPSQSTISYKLEGSVGSRTLKIEWKNVGFYSEIEVDDLSSDYTNFQLWLFEGSDNIEMHYGPNSISQPTLCYEGETGTFIGMFPNYDWDIDEAIEDGVVLSGDPSSPTTNSTTLVYKDHMIGTIPNGTIYKFSKSPANLQDFENDIAVFELAPNPAHNQITISLSDEKQHVQSVEILDATGKVVHTAENILKPIDISEFAVGVYMVSVSTDSHMYTSRLIKQ